MGLLLALIVLQAIAGCHAQLLQPGSYRLRHPGRTNCGLSQGLLSSYACASGIARATVINRQQPSTEWRIQPVVAGAPSIGATTPVHLVAAARAGCGTAYATWPAACAPGVVTLTAAGAAPARQKWVVEPWGATWRLRPANCPGRYLSFSAVNCAGIYGQVQPVMANFTSAFSLYGWADGALVKPPAGSQPGVPPLPKPSPPPPSPVPSPPPSPVPSPPPPQPPTDPPNDGSGLKPNVEATAAESSRWGQGYEGAFRLVNKNAYDILNWKLTFTMAGGNFTWGPSDVDVSWQGAAAELVPKDWAREIKAGATAELKFGGSGTLPTNLQFVQILPLVDPSNDPSLKTRGTFPAKVFAPFIDVMLFPTPRLLDFYEAAGQKWFTLAFITADQRRLVPAWGGVVGMEKQLFVDQIRDVRLRGGDVIVSFGGAAGQELAQVITDENALLGMYQSVVDQYRLRWIDFDIEGQAVAQPASVDRRNRVLARLQAANPALTVSYTLPVLPAGLTADGVRLLESAARAGVRVDVLNIMTMDYGDSAAPDPDGRMGDYAIQAAEETYRQALAAGLAPKIGNTPMIGRNDVETEVFYQADAHKLARWAAATPWVRWTAFWSLGRDKFNGENYVSIHSSSIPQQPMEFTRIFKSYAD